MSDQVKLNGSGGPDATAATADPHNGNPQESLNSGANGNGGNGQQPQTLNLAGEGDGTAGTAVGMAANGAAAGAGGPGGDGGSMAGDDAGTDAGASSIPPSEVGGRPPLDTVGSEGGGPSSMGGMVGPPSPLTGCYLLIILGEPHSEEHKDNILQHLLKGK